MSDAPQIRIGLADDHALVLEGLRALLSAEPDLIVVATATDGERLLDAVRRLVPMWWPWIYKCLSWMA